MAKRKIPITRLEKFFGEPDLDLDISMGREWLETDLNFTFVLYKVDREKTKTDEVYGETVEDGIKFHSPIELKGYVQIETPENKDYGDTKMSQMEPGNLKIGIYQDYLDELDVDIEHGDYIGYYETETRVRYYNVVNDGRIVSDNRHTYGGYKPFYRSIVATPVNDREFKGI